MGAEGPRRSSRSSAARPLRRDRRGAQGDIPTLEIRSSFERRRPPERGGGDPLHDRLVQRDDAAIAYHGHGTYHRLPWERRPGSMPLLREEQHHPELRVFTERRSGVPMCVMAPGGVSQLHRGVKRSRPGLRNSAADIGVAVLEKRVAISTTCRP